MHSGVLPSGWGPQEEKLGGSWAGGGAVGSPEGAESDRCHQVAMLRGGLRGKVGGTGGQQGASIQAERLLARPRGRSTGWLDCGCTFEEAELKPVSNVGVPGVQRDRKRVWDGGETLEPLVGIWGLGGGGLGTEGPVVWAKPSMGTVGHLGVGVALWDSWLGRGGGGEGH